MSKYKPPVLPHQYEVHFTPIMDPKYSQEEIKAILHFIEKYAILCWLFGLHNGFSMANYLPCVEYNSASTAKRLKENQ
jgi:hypothetical protein